MYSSSSIAGARIALERGLSMLASTANSILISVSLYALHPEGYVD